MNSSFFLKTLGLTFILAAVIYFCKSLHLFDDFGSFVWISLAFLSLTTLAVHMIVQQAMAMKAHYDFLVWFGVAFALKSLGSLVFLCYFIFICPIADRYFILPFFLMYFMFTGLLVWHIWQESRQKPLP